MIEQTNSVHRIVRVGHRGAAGYAPENTLQSIERALSLSVDYIEVDVQQTRDQHLIILHDKRVDRTTGHKGYLADMTLAEVRQLDAGDGRPIPTLTEVLQVCSRRAGLILELIADGISSQTIAAVYETGFAGPVIYASFLHKEMLAVRSKDPKAATLALIEAIPVNGVAFARDANVNYVGLGFDSVRPEIINELHGEDLRVFVYTLNDPRDIELAASWGVDGIISDYPDRIPSDLSVRA